MPPLSSNEVVHVLKIDFRVMDPNSEMPADVSYGPSLLTTCWIFAAVATVIVTLRLVTRITSAGHLSADDYFMTVSLILALAASSLDSVAVSWGFGRHFIYLDPKQKYHAVKFDFIDQIFLIMTPVFGRISFALFLIQVLRKNIKRRRFLYVIIVTQVIVNVTTSALILAQCRPLKSLWDTAVNVDCWGPQVQLYSSYFQGSWNSLSDLTLALFPASFLWDLKLPLRKRVGLIMIMGLGIVAMVASIIKTIQLGSLTVKDDFTYATAPLILWATIELYLVIIAASIPTLVPAYKWAAAKLHSYKSTVTSWTAISTIRRGSVVDNDNGDISHLVPGFYTQVVGKTTSEEDYNLPTYPSSSIMKSTKVVIDRHGASDELRTFDDISPIHNSQNHGPSSLAAYSEDSRQSSNPVLNQLDSRV